MNLGGIKVSSAEIERLLNTVAGVAETAAVGVQPEAGGPSRLVIYAVPDAGAEIPAEELHARFRHVIRERLNRLFSDSRRSAGGCPAAYRVQQDHAPGAPRQLRGDRRPGGRRHDVAIELQW